MIINLEVYEEGLAAIALAIRWRSLAHTALVYFFPQAPRISAQITDLLETMFSGSERKMCLRVQFIAYKDCGLH